jgi:hypothetical protein
MVLPELSLLASGGKAFGVFWLQSIVETLSVFSRFAKIPASYHSAVAYYIPFSIRTIRSDIVNNCDILGVNHSKTSLIKTFRENLDETET